MSGVRHEQREMLGRFTVETLNYRGRVLPKSTRLCGVHSILWSVESGATECSCLRRTSKVLKEGVKKNHAEPMFT